MIITSFLSFTTYRRFKTREVLVGNIAIGGNNPIRIQSMTNTNTQDVEATVLQINKIVQAGADLVRVAVPTIKDVDAIKEIKKKLKQQHINVPIIADVHFNPDIAIAVAPFVEKVRINPGNYVNRSKSQQHSNDIDEQQEIEATKKQLQPLLQICNDYGTAIRIGINYASLSWRMVNKYGNTPMAMVQSALEFIEICRSQNFNNLIISLKASDVHTTLYANRLFVEMMNQKGYDYPIHVGVTEAGLDIEGRIKSAIGIGSVLCDGIGDTIRVSLTESPEKEIPIAQSILNFVEQQKNTAGFYDNSWKHSPFNYEMNFKIINGEKVPYFVCSLNSNDAYTTLNNNNYHHIVISDDIQLYSLREKVYEALDNRNTCPIVLHFKLTLPVEKMLVPVSVVLGNLLLESLIDAIIIECKNEDLVAYQQLIKNILSITGVKRLSNEYISCPSCSRTLFNIEEITREIKEATSKYKGYKIAVMGCIVNGPGEMSDADFGIIGAGHDRFNFYVKGKLKAQRLTKDEAIQQLLNQLEKEDQRNGNS